MNLIKLILMGLAMTVLSACSKTVQWEEEVPLNTGDVIWVSRTVEYKLQGTGGNPLDLGYWPSWTEEIAFEWKDKKYKYMGDAGIMLLAISPTTNMPVLVARADLKNWDIKNNYRCATPFYVQLQPSASGSEWTWPPKIEPWLFNASYNLMHHRADDGRMKSRYTSQDRIDSDHITRHQSPSLARIDPTFTFKADCKGKN
jgi:hypothetical protein